MMNSQEFDFDEPDEPNTKRQRSIEGDPTAKQPRPPDTIPAESVSDQSIVLTPALRTKGTAARKTKRAILFRRLCEDINKLSENNKIVLNINNLIEGTVYQIISIKYIVTKILSVVIILELEDGLIYLPFKYRDYFLAEIYGLSESGTVEKITDWVSLITTNEIDTTGLSMRTKKSERSKWPDILLTFNENG